MGKCQKKKSSDFQKVKLKVGRKKPVGQNLTKTTFRTSTIQISNQLEEKDEPTIKRNLSLKVLKLSFFCNCFNAVLAMGIYGLISP